MSEAGEYSDSHGGEMSEFSQRAHEFYGKMSQVIFDVISEIAGEPAAEFAREMRMNIDLANDVMPTMELVEDIEQLFPGARRMIVERWRVLVTEAGTMVAEERQRIQAEKDELILRQYDESDEFTGDESDGE